MNRAFLKLRAIVLKGVDQGNQYEFTLNVNGTQYVYISNLEYKEMTMAHFPLFNTSILELPFTFNITVSAKNLITNQVSIPTNVVINLNEERVEEKTIIHFNSENPELFPVIDLYWMANPFSSVFSELFELAICLCKVANVYDAMPSQRQVEYDNLHVVSTQPIFTELEKISNSLGIYFEPFDSNLSFCENLKRLIDNLRRCQEAWDNNMVVVLDYNSLENNFQTFQSAFQSFKTALAPTGIDPCGKVDKGFKYGVLCGLYDKELDCICKFISQKATFPLNIQNKISELEAKGEYFLGSLYNNFLGYHNITDYPQINLSGGNPFCKYYTAIIGLLKWICDNQNKYPFEQEKVFDIQNEWTEILDLLKELKALDPNVCSGVTNPWGKNAKLMSDYIYLQATGSDASDGVAEGIHLRWALRKEIGENHLPKGDLANTGSNYHANYGYTKENDVVQIHKTPYTNTVPIELDLSTTMPYDVISNANERRWHFIVNNNHGAFNIQNEVIFRFFDFTAYDAIVNDPKSDPLGFLSNYSPYFEVEVKDKLLFAANLEVISVGGSSPQLKYETISILDPNSNEYEITSRQSINSSSFNDINQRIVGENIKQIRIEFSGGDCGLISLETYLDFLKTRPSWTHVADFGLTLTDAEANNRLDNSSWLNTIDNNWPRFNHGTTVKKANYENKWSDAEGLKEAVTSYLDLSKTDMRAVANLESDDIKDTDLPKPVLPISYLDILNLVGMDYHVARMLGLGHIDEFNLNNNKYVYIAIYNTHPDLPQNRTVETYDHVYMALPTDKTDFRKPHKPKMKPIEYGLKSVDDQIASKMLKEGGYSRFDNNRFIALGRDNYDYEIPYGGFFESPIEFDVTNSVKPVFYGIEYKEQGANDYVKPEITANNSGYKDHDSNLTEVFEMIPIAESQNPLFTHIENNEGFHEYALYGINWFSRVSEISDPEVTDETSFDFDPIKAPLDASAHYIQVEDPRIFTSLNEQNELQARITNDSNADNYWTRVTFNWNHLHNIAYQGATKVEFFYREELPLSVKGMVETVTAINGEDAVFIQTKSYNEASSVNNKLIEPIIASVDESKFIGSLLNIEGENYEVLSITQGTNLPIIKVKLTSETQTVVGAEGKLEPILTWNRPVTGSYFQLIENLSNEANWVKLTKEIDLIEFSTRTENITEPGGDVVNYNIGGIEGNAIVIEDPATEPVVGLYKITFDTVTLADHIQKSSEHVDWYQGIIRVPTNGGEMKGLKVLTIESQNPLIVWAIDTEPASLSPTAIYTNSTVSVEVNFHPGYRVYLEPEANKNFDKTHLIPSNNESKKTALLSIRSIDDSDSNNIITSKLTNPMTIFGLNIKVPQKPSEPMGALYSTRPNTFGKCSYTFDIETTVEPFSIAIYRTHEFALLEALYEDATIESIYADIELLETNDYQTQRYNDLANVILDDDPNHEGEWKEYDGYRFPNPDLIDLLDGNETIEQKTHKIKVAITKTFIPVSEQPIIHEFIETGTNTSNISPNIRDKNGNLLDTDDPDFNPFPYARKFTSSEDSKPYLRFTDYKLDGASQNYYFYFAVEITRELKISEPSQVLGPIRIINAFPAEAPYVKKVETVLANPAFETGPGVRFYMNPYLPEENIKAFRIYRTTNEILTASVQLMENAGTIEIGNELIDYFEDLTFPPFNQDIYYRIVALRQILNEQDELEYVPSKPSEVVKGQVVDNVNPPAPEISHTIDSTTTSPDKFLDIDLTWPETCYHGKYTLYKMSDMGQWQFVTSLNYDEALSFNYVELDKEDADGDTIYHRFKVVVENTGGLLSLEEEILTI